MPRPALRSTSWIKKKLRTPGGRKVTHYLKRKNASAKCAECGTALQGVPKTTDDKMSKIAKTRKRPERPYGGTLCTKCMRQKIVRENLENISKK